MRWLSSVLLVLAAALAVQAQEDQGSTSGTGCDYLVVCPQALAMPLEALRAHRQREGLGVSLLTLESFGTNSSSVLREAIRARVKQLRPRFLLLVGDVDRLPAYTLRKVATDRPYGDFDGEDYPEVAVGRFPSNDPRAIARIARRTVNYELKLKAGAWRKQCALLAGEARFSPLLDWIIERFFARIVSSTVPGGYDVDLTYANPRSRYCYPPAQYSDRVVERINEGALVCAYIGHGRERSLDQLTVPATGGKKVAYDVLDIRHVPRVQAQGNPPIFVAIACLTGKYDDDRQSIGEALIASEGGPVAFLGASRISHPIHNALLAKELVREIFSARGPVRLGPAVDGARLAMVQGQRGRRFDLIRRQILFLGRTAVGAKTVEAEMPRHVDMYNLFGDPALRVARPEGEIELRSPRRVEAGQVVEISGRVEPRMAGKLTLTFEVDREESARPEAAGEETAVERYVRANDKVVMKKILRTQVDGSFQAELKLPARLPSGKYFVKAFLESGTLCALGARECELWGSTAERPAGSGQKPKKMY